MRPTCPAATTKPESVSVLSRQEWQAVSLTQTKEEEEPDSVSMHSSKVYNVSADERAGQSEELTQWREPRE